MSDFTTNEQSRLTNKLSDIQKDLQFKFPNSKISGNTTPAFMQSGEIAPAQKLDLQPETVDPSLLYKELPSGDRIAKFPNYITGIGEEQRLAQNQTTANKWTNGITKFLGKTGNAVLGGTVGSVYGIFEAVKDGSLDALWDNDFNNYLDDLNVKMDYQLPNFYTEQERDAGFIDSLGSANFWANDFLGGLSFTVGTIVSEGLWAAATGGTSLVTSAARLGLRGANATGKVLKGVRSAKDISKAIKETSRLTKGFIKKSALKTAKATNYGKAAQALNTLRFTYTSAGYEAGVEARQYIREQKENFENNFIEFNGRPPSLQERLEFNKNLNSTANAVFSANLALVGASNLAILGKMYNVSSPIKAPTKWVNKKLFGVGVNKTADGTFKSIKRTQLQKVLGTGVSIFKAPFIEGVVEEGGQAVAATSAGAFLEAQYNNQKPAIDLVESMYEGLSHTYGTKEGWKEVGLGMLIGLVGGQTSNLASGQGLFSDIKNLKKRDELEAKARNLYSSEKLVAEISKNAVIERANQEASKAEQRGDLTGESLANDMAMMANIMVSEKFDYSNDAKEDLFSLVDMISDETISEQYGAETSEEIETVRSNIKESYSKLQQEYSKNREFAEYQIGNQKLPEGSMDATTAKEMLAYQMTMASRAEELSQNYLEEIKNEVLGFTSEVQNYSQALDLQDALMKTSTGKKREYNNLQRRFKRAQKALDLAEKRSRIIDNNILVRAGEENQNTTKLAKELDINNKRIQELNEEIESITSDINILTEGILLSSPFRETSDIVRSFEVIDINESLDNLQNEIDAIKQTNPVQVAKLEKLTQEYKKSLYITENYGKLVNGLLNPQLGLKGDNRRFFNRAKTLNQATLDFLQTLENAKTDYEQIQEKFETTQTVEPEEKELDDIADEPQVETSTEVGISPVETLIDKLNSLLKNNSYLLEYFGEDVLEKRPTIQEVEEISDLKNKYQDKDINILINVDPNRLSNTARGGLTVEEIVRYQQLAEQLGNWRLLDGVESNGISILDIIDQIDALQKPVAENTSVKDTTTETEDLEIAFEAKQVDTQESVDPSLLQTYDTVLVKQNKNTTELTHINLSSFVDRGAVVKENGVPLANLETIQKEIGRTFTIEIGSKIIPVKVVGHNRLRFENSKFQDLLNETNLKVINMSNVKGSRWSSVYEKTEEGYKPLETDYNIDPNDSGFTQLSPEGIYDIELGQNVFFKLSLNDSWNRSFEKEIDNLNINDQNQVEKLKKKIKDQALIYAINENNQVVGVLKAANEKSNDQEFLTIRQKAADILFESYLNKNESKPVHSLPFSTQVEKIFVGHPNLTFTEDSQGKLIPQKTSINERTINMVESFGFSRNGEIVQNPNTQIDTALVNTQYVQNLEGNVPVAIIKYKNQQIAYPITIQKRDSGLLEQVTSVLTSNDTNTQKVVKVANLLSENGIDPKQYNMVQSGDVSFIGSQNQVKMLRDIENIQVSIQPEEFLSASYSKDRLIQDASITINLENKPFRNPKLKMDYSSISPVTQNKSFEEDLFDRTGRVMPSTINSIVNKIAEKKERNLSEFEKKVLDSQSQEIEQLVEEKLSMSEENKNKSKKERNKPC